MASSAAPVREIDLDLSPGGLEDVTMTMRLTGDKLASSSARRAADHGAIEGARDAIAERLAAIGQPLGSLIIQQTGSTDGTNANRFIEPARATVGEAGGGARRSGRSARLSARLFSLLAAPAGAGSLACEREMTRAAAETGVPLNVLYSVGLTETGHRGELGLYDMNVDGREVHSEQSRRGDGALRAGAEPKGRSSSTSAACRSTSIFMGSISVRWRNVRSGAQRRLCGELPQDA